MKLTAKRHCDYGSNQWAIFDESDHIVELPVTFDHPELGTIQTTRLFYQRKRDAIAAIAEVTN